MSMLNNHVPSPTSLGEWDSLPIPFGITSDHAAKLAQDAHAAAMRHSRRKFWELLWQLKDLPRVQAVREAVNARRGKDGRTLLHLAASKGFMEPVKVLLELAASVSAKDAGGRTALHLAAENNRLLVVRLLLSRGRAHADVRDASGRTPLFLAASRGHAAVARVLMRFGANPEASDCNLSTPITAAKEHKRLSAWLEQFLSKRQKISAGLGGVKLVKQLGAELPAHIVAPKLQLTPVGYCPVDENGEVIMLARGIRCNKSRKGPSTPNNRVNWYCPRG